jgi:hypothetical protein
MTETKQSIVPVESVPQPPQKEEQPKGVQIWLIVVVAVALLALLATAIFFLAKAPPTVTTQIRDIFIILMAFEFLVLGAALIILIVQLAKMVNLLQNEVKPILEATSETVKTLKGTTDFLSNNLVEPVIKLNGYLAGIKKALDLFRLFHK